jgi:hypothetical protein
MFMNRQLAALLTTFHYSIIPCERLDGALGIPHVITQTLGHEAEAHGLTPGVNCQFFIEEKGWGKT